jgi:hypothetical protein
MGHAALAGLVFGSAAAVAFMGGYVARAVYSMTRQNRWRELRKL